MLDVMHQTDEKLVDKWTPVLEGINDEYTRRVTAQLLENQAKSIVEDKMNEAVTAGTTTTGQLGTFQKFAFPLVRRVYPNLIANNLVGVQPMQGPVSQVFYLGNDRASGSNIQTVYSKFNLTYRGLTASAVGSQGTRAQQTALGANTFGINGARGTTGGLDGDNAESGFDVSNVLDTVSGLNTPAGLTGVGGQVAGAGAPSGTMGGQIAAFPNLSSTYGYQLSAGERLTGTGIPEMTFHIEQEAVVANTRKMRALWTLEATQDLKAYHNLDLERELTELLSKELALEVDRELIEDLRMIAYGYHKTLQGGASIGQQDNDYISMGEDNNSFAGVTNPDQAGFFVPRQFTYDFNGAEGTGSDTELGAFKQDSNIFTIDFGMDDGLAPRHVGEVYANLLAVINLASQDIYKTTMRGPGNWILTSPLVASLLESASKLEGGIAPADGPTNISKSAITFKGKFMGRYDLYVDPMYPTDEILVGYKGDNAMDAGMIYAPYIPLQQLPTVVDPETFQPRKGILTRYGKVTIEPYNRYYRIIRIVGPTSNFLYSPFAKNTAFNGTTVPSYI